MPETAMTVAQNEHERTLAFAQISLDQIRALAEPATPRNFAIWYHYATGYNPALNRAINQTLEQKGALAEADLEHIYDTYIATVPVGDAVDSVGSRVLDEIKQVLAMIDAASGTTTSYSESLADASAKLAATSDRDTLRAVIERLIEGTRDMEINNKKLEASLSASRQEIEQLHQNLATGRTESQTDPLTGPGNPQHFEGAPANATPPRGLPPANCSTARWPRRSPRPRRSASRCRCSWPTSIISSCSTTNSATRPAITCCAWSRSR